MSSISLRGVTKNFGETAVIRGVDIDIEPAEFAVFVGPSGCGKSTLLRIVAGLDQPSSGEVVIGGTVVNDLSPRERDVAMVFQNYALYPHMTVAQNIGFGLKISRVAAPQIAERVAEAARILGLDALLARLPRQLSGGQRQRVAMGRAIARDPAVFLFDEPLSNLDAKLRVQMRTEIRALHQRLGATSIYVTHDQIEAMTMADRIVVLRDGRVEQIGTPAQLYDAPVNAFVATFIGSPAMNLLRLQGDGERWALADATPLATVAAPGGIAAATLGVRPEHLELVAADSPGAWPATLEVVEFAGADTLLSCRLGDTDRADSPRVMALVHHRVSERAGDRVGLRPGQAGLLHWFASDDAAEPGKRLP
jgi:multiple sugar transport system ATP-binding protein